MRRGHGQVAARPALGGPARRRLAPVLVSDGATVDDDRDADSHRRRRAGAARAQTELQRLRARLRHPRLSRPQARHAYGRAAWLRLEGRDDSGRRSSASPSSPTRNRAPSTNPSSITFSTAYLGAKTSDWIAAFQSIEKRSAEGTAGAEQNVRPQRATRNRNHPCRSRPTPADIAISGTETSS